MDIVCIIPARGGSKRLPGKNIRPLLGIPLIEYSINAALESRYITKTYVSTDDAEIAGIASLKAVNVIHRPAHLASDTATTTDAIKHAVDLLSKEIKINCVVILQPTNPFRPPGFIDECIEEFLKKIDHADSLMTVSENKLKLGKIDGASIFHPITYTFGQRSQDLDKYYYENGLVYLTKETTLKEYNSIFGAAVIAKVVDEDFAEVDIDTVRDFEWAEIIAKQHKLF